MPTQEGCMICFAVTTELPAASLLEPLQHCAMTHVADGTAVVSVDHLRQHWHSAGVLMR